MKIGVLGAGGWGSALANLLAGNGHEVIVWSIDEREVAMLKEFHEQRDRLPGVILNSSIEYTTDASKAVIGQKMIVCAVPSPFVRSTAKNIADKVSNGQLIVNVSKGIEESTLKALVEIIEEEIPQAKVAVLSGPSHAEEVGRGIPTTVVAGARDIEIAKTIQNAFMNDYFRVYTSTDVTGIELGGSVKNVIALAAGISDGLGLGDNTKAALMTRGMAEIMSYHRSLLDLQRNGLDKSAEHEYCKTCSKSKIHDHDSPWSIKVKCIRSSSQSKHNHLERYYHREHAEQIYDLCRYILDSGYIPGCHRAEQQNCHY